MSKRRRQHLKTGLVLQGGGVRGAYQVGVLKAIAELLGKRKNPFPIITGASAGAINAAALAAGAMHFPRAIVELESLWRNLRTKHVFDTRTTTVVRSSAKWLWALGFGGAGLGTPRSLLDNSPLRLLLEQHLHDDQITQSIRRGALDALCISTSSYTDGRSITFFEAGDLVEEWRRARRDGVRTKIGVNHLLASSALPFVFSAVKLNSSYFGDGSMRLTSPLSPAIRMGADKLLVIRARHNTPESLKPHEAAIYPSLGDIGGHALDILFNDNLDSDIERLKRINNTLTLLSPAALQQTDLRSINVLALEPSTDLSLITSEHSKEMPRSVRILLRSLGSGGRQSRLLSYLLFEPGHINALIELGYQDTLNRSSEVIEFLDI